MDQCGNSHYEEKKKVESIDECKDGQSRNHGKGKLTTVSSVRKGESNLISDDAKGLIVIKPQEGISSPSVMREKKKRANSKSGDP